MYGLTEDEEIVKNFIVDLKEYTEFLIREEIKNIPYGTYFGED